MIGTVNLYFLSGFVDQLDLWPQTLGLGLAAALRIDNHQRRQARDIVNLFGDRYPFFDMLELHSAGIFGNDRPGMRIPHGEHGACLDLLAVVTHQRGAIRNLVALALAAVVVGDEHFA